MKKQWLLIGGPAHLSIAWNLCDSRTMFMRFKEGCGDKYSDYEYHGYKVYSLYDDKFYMVGVQELKELDKHDVPHLIKQANLTPI